jgi:voltage-gated potassium channel
VTFLDEMLKSEDNLRVEEIVVPSGYPATTVAELKQAGRDYILLALREQKSWNFNPPDDKLIKPGFTLIVMATPAGRKQLEKAAGWI